MFITHIMLTFSQAPSQHHLQANQARHHTMTRTSNSAARLKTSKIQLHARTSASSSSSRRKSKVLTSPTRASRADRCTSSMRRRRRGLTKSAGLDYSPSHLSLPTRQTLSPAPWTRRIRAMQSLRYYGLLHAITLTTKAPEEVVFSCRPLQSPWNPAWNEDRSFCGANSSSFRARWNFPSRNHILDLRPNGMGNHGSGKANAAFV